MEGGGSLTVAGGGEGKESLIVFGFSIFGNNMNTKPGEQKLHRKGKEGIGLIPFGPTLIGTYFISFV